jgi:hypothetical protein
MERFKKVVANFDGKQNHPTTLVVGLRHLGFFGNWGKKRDILAN